MSKKQSTSLGKLPSNWVVVPLADYVFFQEGPGLRNWQWTTEGMKVINVTNILSDGSVDICNTDRYISLNEFRSRYSHFSVEDGDIVVASSGNTYGKVGRINSRHLPVMMNTSVIRFHPRDPEVVHPGFLYAFLRSPLFRNQIEAYVIGSAQPNFGPYHLKRMSMPLPPFKAQTLVADIVSAYDNLIENNTRRIKILERMAQLLYREWFVNFRFSGYEKVKMVESEIGVIPNGWQVSAIGEVTTKIGSGATPRGGKESYQTTGISLIRSLNVYDYRFEMDDLAFISDEQAQQLDNVTVVQEDVLLNITGASVGRCAMVPSYILPARVNQHVAIIRANPTKIDPFFLLDTINNDRNKQTLLGIAQGGATREALTKETIIQFQILLPPFDLIRRYGQIASQLHQQREKLSRKNEVLRSTRDLLVPKLVSTEISVQQIEKEAIVAPA